MIFTSRLICIPFLALISDYEVLPLLRLKEVHKRRKLYGLRREGNLHQASLYLFPTQCS